MTRAAVVTAFLAAWAAPGWSQQFSRADDLAPYIPTPQAVVERMLEAGHVKPGEVVYDLGSGDGRIVITAVQKFGARAVGVELSPDLYRNAVAKVRALGLEDRIKFVHGSALRVDLSPADVVTMYLLTSSNEKLKPNLEKYLKPGARVVTNEFPIKGWNASETILMKTPGMVHHIYVYQMGKNR